MWAMIVKEFRQLRRDRRTLAMMIILPILLLIVFGYAASFDVQTIPTKVVGPLARQAAGALHAPFQVDAVSPDQDREDAVASLRDGHFPAAVVAEPTGLTMLLDGSDLFTANAARAAAAKLAPAGTAAPGSPPVRMEILFNPDLKTSAVMVPGLAGMILLFVGTVITSLGVVRERQSGTLEQLAVMPLRPGDVFIGKVAPYFLVAAIDMVIVVVAGTLLFGVPFNGSALVLALGALLFLFVTLGTGVLISSVSQNQGQAIQLAMMVLLPQILLSGLIFPLRSMPIGVRWIAYILPLTYFTQIARGVMLRGASIAALWQPFVLLTLIGVVIVVLATLRFRSFLAPSAHRARPASPAEPEVAAGATR